MDDYIPHINYYARKEDTILLYIGAGVPPKSYYSVEFELTIQNLWSQGLGRLRIVENQIDMTWGYIGIQKDNYKYCGPRFLIVLVLGTSEIHQKGYWQVC